MTTSTPLDDTADRYPVDGLIARLSDIAARDSRGMADDLFALRGLWKIDYRYRPNPLERDLSYGMVYAQGRHMGAAYIDYGSGLVEEALLGQDLRRVRPRQTAVHIAALDAAFAELPRSPAAVHRYEGLAEEKAVERARIICGAVAATARRRGLRRVLNIGVMGNFVPWLVDAGLAYVGSDYDRALIAGGINGRPVVDGSTTLDAIDDADVVLATGMTLTTGTLQSIIDRCHASGVALVLFAATGSHFAQTYCREFGVDVVVAEPQPQYMFQGVSTIEIHEAPRGSTV